MPLSERDNFIRAVRRTGPEWIPCRVMVSASTWLALGKDLEAVLDRHRWLFPDFEKGTIDYEHFDPGLGRRAGERFTDNWGCVWDGATEGIWGQCVQSPLEDWKNLERLRVPDPDIEDDYSSGRLGRHPPRAGRTPQGRQAHLRRTQPVPLLEALVPARIRKPDDRFHFGRAETPTSHRDRGGSYASRARALVHDGSGLRKLRGRFRNPEAILHQPPPFPRMAHSRSAPALQIRARTGTSSSTCTATAISWSCWMISSRPVPTSSTRRICATGSTLYRGRPRHRVCINLDIDRQTVVPFGTRNDIRDLIKEEVMKLGSPRRGTDAHVRPLSAHPSTEHRRRPRCSHGVQQILVASMMKHMIHPWNSAVAGGEA